MQLLYLLSIAASRKTIDISASYFVPDEAAVAELVAAMKRGVRVRIILPGEHIDWNVVRRASRARCWRRVRKSMSTSRPCIT